MDPYILTPPTTCSDWLRMQLLYISAFPRSERKPLSVIKKMYRNGKSDIWCIRNENRFLGFAFTVNSPQLILLDYLAVQPRFRNRGVGSFALKALQTQYSGKGIVLEIDSTAAPVSDLALRLRRKAFYESCGMRPLDVEAVIFGVRMELMGQNCTMTFCDYKTFYRDYISVFASNHVLPVKIQEGKYES